MFTIGLIGGVASGKSHVGQCFRDLGACVLDVDRMGHEVLTMSDVVDTLHNRWGDRIKDAEARLDRAAVASIVFGDDESAETELAFLESVTHPHISAKIEVQIQAAQQRGRHRATVLDAAVLLKAGWDKYCDFIVFVDAPLELRRKRALLRGLSEAQFVSREANQWAVKAKRERADYVIDNSGPPQKTRQQVEQVWHSLPEIA